MDNWWVARGVARRTQILAAVEDLTRELGRFPKPVEVAARTAMPSSSVHFHVLRLEQAGRLRRRYNGRGLQRLPDPPD
jgi:hypothetical protein